MPSDAIGSLALPESGCALIAAFSFRAWFPLNPALVLGFLVLLSAAAGLLARLGRRRRKRALRELAARWQMTYSPGDQLRVADKLLGRFPVPGVADVHVTDVIYGGQGDQYRYLFTVEYTLGAVRGKRRQARVATFCEPRGRAPDASPGAVVLAPEDLTLLDQYVKLGPAQTSEAGRKAAGAGAPP